MMCNFYCCNSPASLQVLIARPALDLDLTSFVKLNIYSMLEALPNRQLTNCVLSCQVTTFDYEG
jgi:hypothetical protein